MIYTNRSRREFLREAGAVAGALSVSGLIAACGGDEGGEAANVSGDPLENIESTEVVFADYGGTVRDARNVIYFEPFKQQTGIEVIPADADPARLVLQAERGRSEWDCYESDGFEAIDYLDRGLLEELPSNVQRSDLVGPELQDYMTGGFSYSYALGFRTDLVNGAGPQDWADFWNVDKFPGKRSWPRLYISACEPALLADGVEPEDLYPLDFERAYAKLDELRSNMLFYESFSEGMQFVVSGNASMVLMPNARIVDAAEVADSPIEVVWNQAIHFPYEGPVIPKGAPNLDAMYGLADFMTNPELQAQFSRLTNYGPVVEAALDFLDAEEKAMLPNSPEHVKIAAVVDSVELAKQNAEYSESYTEWLAQS